MQVEGRVLGGLDEFMLRVGHLSVLARVAHEAGGSWNRIQREAGERLAAEVDVRPERNTAVADYLAAKELCLDASKAKPKTDDYRYPNLRVVLAEGGIRKVESLSGPLRVSWQDYALSEDDVPSRVGAVNSESKSGSKTSLSHISDWAQFLEIIDTTGRLSPIGKLLVTLPKSMATPLNEWNPYKPGLHLLFVAYEYFRRDLDLLVRFAPLLAASQGRLTKSTCRKHFVEALQLTCAAAESSSALTSRVRFELMQQLRDLERAARRSRASVEDLSTAWHRAASRVEALTDFGLLEKSGRERYQYAYLQTKLTARLSNSLLDSQSADDWLDNHFASFFVGPSEDQTPIAEDELLPHVDKIVRCLSLPTSVLPIDCLALGVVHELGAARPTSFGKARRAIEGLAMTRTDLARLARGREGTRAEYISLNLKRVSESR